MVQPSLDCLPLIKKFKQRDLILAGYNFKFIRVDNRQFEDLNEDDEYEYVRLIFKRLHNLVLTSHNRQHKTFLSIVLIDYVMDHLLLINEFREEIKSVIVNNFYENDMDFQSFGMDYNPFHIWRRLVV